jgi:hypothetical protein
MDLHLTKLPVQNNDPWLDRFYRSKPACMIWVTLVVSTLYRAEI